MRKYNNTKALKLKYYPKDLYRYEKIQQVLIKSGKKVRAHRIFEKAEDLLQLLTKKQYNKEPKLNFLPEKLRKPIKFKSMMGFINKILFKLTPTHGFRRIYRGGRLYQIPVMLTQNREAFLSALWLRRAMNEKAPKNLKTHERLVYAICETEQNVGGASFFLKEHMNIGKDMWAFRRFIRRKHKGDLKDWAYMNKFKHKLANKYVIGLNKLKKRGNKVKYNQPRAKNIREIKKYRYIPAFIKPRLVEPEAEWNWAATSDPITADGYTVNPENYEKFKGLYPGKVIRKKNGRRFKRNSKKIK